MLIALTNSCCYRRTQEASRRISPHLTSGPQLLDLSGTPKEQTWRLLFLLFPKDVAESFYREFGDIAAAALAQ
jgi:hypothetical protein